MVVETESAEGAGGALSGMDDAEVIRRSRSDPGAFAVLFDRHAPALHRRYVTRRLGDSLADDIVAETFLAGCGGPSPGARCSPGPWRPDWRSR